MKYLVTATVRHTISPGRNIVVVIPKFILDSSIIRIFGPDDALEIAKTIIDPLNIFRVINIFVRPIEETMNLSNFSDNFWDNDSRNVSDKPQSVLGALEVMPDDEWYEMCRHLFHAEIVGTENVINRIKETNTCTDTNPVEVWIDKAGNFRIKVWR